MAKKQNKNGVVGDTTKITLWEVTYREDIENVIRELNPREYAYILHDKDKETNGNPKKPHYHIWCRWDTPVRNSMIKKALGLTGADYVCRGARSQKACILYMTHETKEAKNLVSISMKETKSRAILILTNYKEYTQVKQVQRTK